MESAHRRPSAALDSRPPCVCGHDAFDHAHYRKGTDCGRCGCGAYRSRVSTTDRLTGGVRGLLRRLTGR